MLEGLLLCENSAPVLHVLAWDRLRVHKSPQRQEGNAAGRIRFWNSELNPASRPHRGSFRATFFPL